MGGDLDALPATSFLGSLTVRRDTVAALAVAALALPLYLLTLQVGLNGDLERYGRDGLQLLCGRGQRVWDNYSFEPLFVVFWLGFAKLWSMGFGDGAFCVDPGLAVFWLPIFTSVILIAIQIYVVRVIGPHALAFHALFCLDILLVTLPFNLIRQFVATVMVLILGSLLIRERLSARAFTALLVLPALVHWSTWTLFGVAMVALMPIEVGRLMHTRIRRLSHAVFLVVAAIAVVALVGYLVSTFLVARVGTIALAAKVFDRVSLEAAVRGVVSPLTVALVLCALAAGRSAGRPFVRRLLVGIAVLYLVGAASGHVPLMERLRAITLPMTYFCFLYAVHKRWLSAQWHVVSVGLLAFSVVNLSRYMLAVQPFADRVSFWRLLE